MIRPPSLLKSWDECVSIDPAFKQAPQLKDGASEDEQKAFKEAVEEYLATLKSCRDNGDWSKLTLDGQQPTRFTMLQVDRNIFRELLDRMNLPYNSHLRVGSAAGRAILVRLALKAISGYETKIERKPDSQWGWEMAQAEIVNELDAIDPRIVGELGTRLLEKYRGVSPF